MRLLALFFAVLLLLSAAPCALAGEKGQSPSAELTRRLGNGINLGNTFEACDPARRSLNRDPGVYETLWGQPRTTRAILLGMKEAGFGTLRIPVAWMTNAADLLRRDYTLSSAYLDRVAQVTDWALDAGMTVIINDHWDGGWYGMFGSEDPDTRAFALEAYTGMWRQIAARFASYGDRLIFEGANEELGARFDENSVFCEDSTDTLLPDDERYALTNRVNQAFVDTVRACGGNNADRFLLIPGYGTDIDRTCDSRFIMPRDSAEGRLLISVHYYSPWSYCGASAASGATAWGIRADLEQMRETLSKMTRFTAAGYGVVIGEYGALPGSDGVMKDNAVLYHRAFLDCCDLFGFASCLWDTSGFYVRSRLAFSDAEMGELYRSRAERLSPEQAEESFLSLRSAAPERFDSAAVLPDENGSVAWIMFSSGDWLLSYSVGDTYAPDTKSPGLIAEDAVITGPGTYTVSLDFTKTPRGCSAGVAFAALGIANGEKLYPGYTVKLTRCLINGEETVFTGCPYTSSDDGLCTRVNLYNAWVSSVDPRAVRFPPTADPFALTPTPLDPAAPGMTKLKTLCLEFEYGPR